MPKTRVRRLVPAIAFGAMMLVPMTANALGCTPNIICPPTIAADVDSGIATR